jgi:sugar/nucleoside kinase (ribokinase family)
VLDQLEAREDAFVLADTIDLWIKTTRDSLESVIRRVDGFAINNDESFLLTGETTIVSAGRAILENYGLSIVIIKKGEHGAYLFHPSGLFMLPAYPVTDLRDPTGAGDSFAGAFLGYLAAHGKNDFPTLKRAMAYATATASLTVEAFSCRRLQMAGGKAIEERFDALVKMVSI